MFLSRRFRLDLSLIPLLAPLENVADFLVSVVVLFLTLNIAVHDYVAVSAGYCAWLMIDWADSEVGFYIIAVSHLVGNQVLIVPCIWMSSKVH